MGPGGKPMEAQLVETRFPPNLGENNVSMHVQI